MDDLTPNEQMLCDNLLAILNGTFQVGLGVMQLGAALKKDGNAKGWKLRAIAKYLEQNQEQIGALSGIVSTDLAGKLATAFAKRADS